MRCNWIEKGEGERKFHQCKERAVWRLDGTKYCDKHLKSVLFHHPGASYRAKPLGKLALLTNG